MEVYLPSKSKRTHPLYTLPVAGQEDLIAYLSHCYVQISHKSILMEKGWILAYHPRGAHHGGESIEGEHGAAAYHICSWETAEAECWGSAGLPFRTAAHRTLPPTVKVGLSTSVYCYSKFSQSHSSPFPGSSLQRF